MKKLIGIGDLFIPCEYIEKGMACLSGYGIDVSTVEWQFNIVCTPLWVRRPKP